MFLFEPKWINEHEWKESFMKISVPKILFRNQLLKILLKTNIRLNSKYSVEFSTYGLK